MPRYNVAYRPEDKTFEVGCIKAAQSSFSSVQDGYILGPENGLPHITACQFDATEDQIKAIWDEIRASTASYAELVVSSTFMDLGIGRHEGYIWAGLSTQRDSGLVRQQRKIYDKLTSKGCTCHTEPDDSYRPHLTFARFRQDAAPRINAFWPSSLLSIRPRAFYLSLGLSTDNGVYTKQLYSTG